MSTMNLILGITLGAFIMGCQQSASTLPAGSMSEPEVTDVATTSTGEMFYLEQKELAKQMLLAKQGDAVAAMRIAQHYEFGENTPQQAHPWLTIAAEKGDVIAMLHLAAYLESDGGQGNCDAALQWFERAKRKAAPEQLRTLGIDDSITRLKADSCKSGR